MPSIFEDIDTKIEELKKHKAMIDDIPVEFLEKRYLQLSIENQISEFERRRDALSSGKYAYACSFCKGWIKQKVPVMVKDITVCDACSSTITKVLNANEAEQRWNLVKGTIKQDARSGGPLEEYKKANLVFKSGRYWQIHQAVMESYYEPKQEQKIEKRNRQRRALPH